MFGATRGLMRKDVEFMNRREWVDRLFREHARDLYRYLRTFRLSEEDTYDLVHDTYVTLLDNMPSQVRQPRVWLFTVGRNLAINVVKRRHRWSENPGVEELVDASPGVLSDMLEDEKHGMLWQAFSKLPGKDREMMALYLDHELNYRQIATVLGKSDISIRVAMHRSRKQLRESLRSMEDQSTGVEEKGD